jgi:hypothetical protein
MLCAVIIVKYQSLYSLSCSVWTSNSDRCGYFLSTSRHLIGKSSQCEESTICTEAHSIISRYKPAKGLLVERSLTSVYYFYRFCAPSLGRDSLDAEEETSSPLLPPIIQRSINTIFGCQITRIKHSLGGGRII